jgi:hypothetical protein
MFVRREITEADRIKKKIRLIQGKTTQDKFKNLLKDILDKLDRIHEFDKFFNKELRDLFTRVREDYRDLTQTTSNEKVLQSALLCEEDMDQLLDDMTHNISQSTYDKRLENILLFLKDFNNVHYQREIKFYQESSSKFTDQLQTIHKDIQYKLSKMTYQSREVTNEILTLENQNIQLANSLASVNKESYQYKDIAHQIQDYHQAIEMNQNAIKLMRKSMNSFAFLANLFQQLSVLDEYIGYLKEDGYIRKLVKRLYRKPDELDLLENIMDLTEAIHNIKSEIAEVEAIVKPASKMIFEDLEDEADVAIIEKYKAMGQ